MTDRVLVGVFLIYISIREWMHAKEVKLLSEAVIAKNVYEYKALQTQPEKPEEDKPPKFIPVDSIPDEDFLRSIRKQLNRQTATDKFKDKIKKIWPKNQPTTPHE